MTVCIVGVFRLLVQPRHFLAAQSGNRGGPGNRASAAGQGEVVHGHVHVGAPYLFFEAAAVHAVAQQNADQWTQNPADGAPQGGAQCLLR
jgi:hypothetical protein